MNEFECFQMYQAVRLHFEGKFDYFKYQGKIKANHKSYAKRNDKYIFRKIAKKYPKNELENLFVSNFVYGRCNWVGELSEDIYLSWKKTNESLGYTFEQDCKFLAGSNPKFWNLLDTDGSHWPDLLDFVNRSKITFESFIILNGITSFTIKGTTYRIFELFDKLLQNDIIWQELKNTAVRYEPFIKYDKYRMKGIFKAKILGETS